MGLQIKVNSQDLKPFIFAIILHSPIQMSNFF